MKFASRVGIMMPTSYYGSCLYMMNIQSRTANLLIGIFEKLGYYKRPILCVQCNNLCFQRPILCLQRNNLCLRGLVRSLDWDVRVTMSGFRWHISLQ